MGLTRFLSEVDGHLDEWVECAVYALGGEGLQANAIDGHPSAIRFSHRVYTGVGMNATHPALAGCARVCAAGTPISAPSSVCEGGKREQFMWRASTSRAPGGGGDRAL